MDSSDLGSSRIGSLVRWLSGGVDQCRGCIGAMEKKMDTIAVKCVHIGLSRDYSEGIFSVSWAMGQRYACQTEKKRVSYQRAAQGNFFKSM